MVGGKAEMKSNPRENGVKSPMGNRHRKSQFTGKLAGTISQSQRDSTLVTRQSNVEDQLAASLNQLLMSRSAAGGRPRLETGNGCPLGGADCTGNRARRRKEKKKRRRSSGQDAGTPQFSFHCYLCNFIVFFNHMFKTKAIKSNSNLIFFPLSVIVCICFRHLARPRDSQTHSSKIMKIQPFLFQMKSTKQN